MNLPNRSDSYAIMINDLDVLTQEQAALLQKRERQLKDAYKLLSEFLEMQENWFAGNFTYRVKKDFVEEVKECLKEQSMALSE